MKSKPMQQAPDVTIPQWMQNVIQTFVRGIPQEERSLCLNGNKPFPKTKSDAEQLAHLKEFVETRLKRLAEYEYKMWMNGRLPFISPREIQIWRLRQFVEIIWLWNLPDDEDIAMIFNTTKQKAANLANDFIARFRKTVLFPVALRRLFALLTSKPIEKEVEKNNFIGSYFRVPSNRYIDDTNLLIAELRQRTRKVLASASSDVRDPSIMWVSNSVLELVAESGLRDAVEEIYPIPEGPGYEG
jgi:hypothetical protein